MSPHDDDRDDLAGTPPQSISDQREDVPAEPAERAQAAAFADLIDTVIAGADLPAVMAAEHRELVDTVAILRANLVADGAAGSGVRGVVDRVMSQVTGQPERTGDDPEDDARPPADERSDVIDFAARRRRRVRWLSIGTAAVAAAVVLVFALRAPVRPRPDAPAAPALSMMHHSRPADPLIGEIPRARAYRASDRLDTIYADRMAGYRDLRLRGGAR